MNFTVAGYTYGSLLGLYGFGLFSQIENGYRQTGSGRLYYITT